MEKKVVIVGACGKMGKELIRLLNENDKLKLIGAIDVVNENMDSGELAGIGKNNVPVSKDFEIISESDVTINFSSPKGVMEALAMNKKYNVPSVIGTTGLTEDEIEFIKRVSKEIPIVFSPNMSIGVNLLFKLTEICAEILNTGFDVEVIEAHHRMKKDAPSGTAKKIVEILLNKLNRSEDEVIYGRKGLIGERKENEIGVSVIRGGDIVGEHTVLFAGIGERIELTHRASSRTTFAKGALKACEWLIDKSPGLYTMFDVLGF